MRIWIRNPLAILAENAAGGVVVEGGVIVELVASGAYPALPVTESFEASGHVVLPGLINTHHHFYQTLTRAHPAAIDRELFPWLKALYPLWARLRPEDLRLAVRAALVELMLSGCTTAADHHYLYPAGLENAVDIAVEEARALGIRVTISRGSMNLSQKDGGLPPDEVVQDEDTILADCERVLGLFHDPKPGSMVQIALAPCSPFSVTTSLMAASAELATRLRFTAAYPSRRDAGRGRLLPGDLRQAPARPAGRGRLAAAEDLAGARHPFSCEECERLGKAGVGVCHCPTSNGVLASGFCKTRELEAAGAPVGLGVDGSASNDGSNLMEELRHALLVNRLHYRSASAVTARDTIRWATEGSARCLGRSDIGRIAPGMQADLALYQLDELRFSGAHDPIAALVLCGATKADRVMVGGRWRVIDGAIPGLDLASLRRAHGAAARRYA